ncbi:hypothetical protein J27TS8_17690 [Robertmurraya siralis]|uniref:Spo0E like sporulation regulatory protein n=1 Tax=Robertmurraya siralis TaxID=77777 RepID=A0A920BTM3_9BACI|nr:aspartyl-phosphate phosphatase Spo0E family protein [Robertmurraya siralis]GIN61776.1 hypothetical protein J27TS8_17690 [Robertmurraya siralis]
MKLERENENLFKNIEMLREQMMISGHRNGLLNSETIKYSQRLDELIFKHQCYKNK